MIPFKLTEELIADIENFIETKNNSALLSLLEDIHYADIAEIINELNEDEATYIIKLLESDKTSDILTELDDDVRESTLR